jgi:hypothetical protein
MKCEDFGEKVAATRSSPLKKLEGTVRSYKPLFMQRSNLNAYPWVNSIKQWYDSLPMITK